MSTAAHAVAGTPIARWRHWAVLACIAPWAAFMLWAAAPQILASLLQLESFPETLNPGYFIIKLATGLLLLSALLEALRFLWAVGHPSPASTARHGR